MKVHGYSPERKQYYNLIRHKSKPSDEEKIEIAMTHLDLQGFHVRFAERYMVENNVRQRRVVEHFLFCSPQQTAMARRFVSGFVIETDATFNTNDICYVG